MDSESGAALFFPLANEDLSLTLKKMALLRGTLFIFPRGATLELTGNGSPNGRIGVRVGYSGGRVGSPIGEDALAQGLEEREPRYLE